MTLLCLKSSEIQGWSRILAKRGSSFNTSCPRSRPRTCYVYLKTVKDKSKEIIFTDNRKKRNAMPPLPIPGIVRVTTLKILGVTLTNGLSASNHIREIITNCAQTLHALWVLRCHGVPGDCTNSLPSCAWSGFITASDRKRVDAFLRRSKHCGFCPPDLPPFNEMIEVQEDHLFSTVNRNPQHLLHYLPLPPSAASQKSSTELITEHYPIMLDISWTRTLFRESYLKTCRPTVRYAISISLSAYLTLNL